MISRMCLLAIALLASTVHATPTVVLSSPVRVVADVSAGTKAATAKLELTIQHGASEFALNVMQRGSAAEALATQRATSGWKDGYLFIRDDCLGDDPALLAWRCTVDHVYTLAEDPKDKSGGRLIYVGDVFAGEECIEAARIGCALYKGTFTDIYDRLEINSLLPRAESPALLIEMTVQGGVFVVDLEETWKANQERFLAGTRCLLARAELRAERCIDGITPRRAFLFNTSLATYTRQDEQLMRTRSFARAALCESGPEQLADGECSDALRAAALLFANIRPGDKPRPRGNVLSPIARKELKP